MPMYEYVCDECGNEEEILHLVPISKVIHPKNCPKCNSDTFHQIISKCLFDVIDGSDYNGGKKDFHSRMSMEDRTKVILGEKDPY